MDEEYVKEIANTAWQQLFWSVQMPVVMSWGVSKKCCTTFQGMPTLMLRVNALVHNGWVYVSLYEATDTYEVRLMNTQHERQKTVEDVYCDNLGSIIDELIEKPSYLTEEEYQEKAIADSNKKMFG